MKEYKNCQSCGMPMSKDPEGGGTELDGQKSTVFCSYCYQDGAFTQPDFTVVEMRNYSKQKMKEMGIPKFIASLLTIEMPSLERWKNK